MLIEQKIAVNAILSSADSDNRSVAIYGDQSYVDRRDGRSHHRSRCASNSTLRPVFQYDFEFLDREQQRAPASVSLRSYQGSKAIAQLRV